MFKEIVLKITQIITNPEAAWRKLKEHENHESFINRYLHPVFGVISLTTFVGGLWLVADGGLEIALKNTIISLVTVYGGYFIASYILNELFPKFGMSKDESKVQQFVGFSSALVYAIFIVSPLLPNLPILWIFAIYTVYIVYMGFEVYISVEEEQRVNFTGVATTVILLTPFIIKGILSILIK